MSVVTEEILDGLRVRVYPTRDEMGRAAARDVADRMRGLLASQGRVRMVFASAPSQNELLDHLVRAEGLDWSRVTAFHMDEYIGLEPDAPQSFGRFLRDRLFDLVHPGRVHLIDSTRPAGEECERYAALLAEAPVDIVCLGIGENGHIAFNDPEVADFEDPLPVKVVELDERSRQQQVNDGCFDTLDSVPRHAITLTIPMLLSGRALFCVVPGPTKREAVRATLRGPVSPECPASVLRRHPDCTLYLDADSYEA